MLYRIHVRDGARWLPIGLDCFDLAEVRTALAMVARGAVWRVVTVGC